MSCLADSLIASDSRPLPLRRRADLVVARHRYQGQAYRVVKDPVGLRYHRFQEEEYAILEMLDGRTSLEELKLRFEQRFTPQQITIDELNRFVASLHNAGLVVSHAPGQGEKLQDRGEKRRRREQRANWTNILYLRFRGFNPDRLLSGLSRWVGWFFSAPAVAACLILVLAAGLLVTVQFDVFLTKLPSFQEFFAAGNWLPLVLAMAAAKVLHELGHGLACKRMGGQCHEMGMMLLVLSPCLYVNVSDSWMLPNKWRRAAIGAAGMYVEVVLAALCVFLWWFSLPGPLHYACLNLMFVTSVSTVLFNANPLMRLDGYYILCDVAEIPNLRAKASAILNRTLGRWLLGIEPPADPFLPRRGRVFFVSYSVAAAAYRWLITLSILWFLHQVFAPYGLQIVGQLIAVAALYGLVVRPLHQLFRFFAVPGRMRQVKRHRAIASGLVVAGLLTAAVAIPLPHYLYCPVQVEPRGATPVYVETGGSLTAIRVRVGQRVRAGQPLVELSSRPVRLDVARLRGELARLLAREKTLRQLAYRDDSAVLDLERLAESIEATREELARRQRQLDRLVVTAPRDGVVLPPADIEPDRTIEGVLPRFSGSPLDKKNLGAQLERGRQICRIGEPAQIEAVLTLDQSQMEFVRTGQKVEIKLNQLQERLLSTSVKQVAERQLEATPAALSKKAGGEMFTRTDAAGRQRPASTAYQAAAPLENDEQLIVLGAVGQARVYAGRQTVAQRVRRYLARTFRW